MPEPSPKRDLISISDVADELDALLDHAARLKDERRRGAGRPTLPGKNLAMIFEKPSTRTRASFEVAIGDLGGHPLYLSANDLQLGRGETIADTARVLSRYVDAVCYRAFRHENVVELARRASVPVVNALDDLEHPCQIVADLLTMHERWPDGFRGRRLAWVGDGNNVLHSLLLGAGAVGLDLTAATPEGYRPRPAVVQTARALAERSGATLAFTTSPEQAAKGADALYTDVWVSMGDEAEREARERAFRGYQVNARLLALADPEAFVLHDLPAHRGQEITDDVLDGERSAAWDQAENRLHAQKAILELLLLPDVGDARSPRRSLHRRPRTRPRPGGLKREGR
ncbi:MAG TPA: ornithine carbamoyltransferase [Thermoplasmata archaeon]|nr:ornithine carbamoyltransferase [Thermoplasmata archaeon]